MFFFFFGSKNLSLQKQKTVFFVFSHNAPHSRLLTVELDFILASKKKKKLVPDKSMGRRNASEPNRTSPPHLFPDNFPRITGMSRKRVYVFNFYFLLDVAGLQITDLTVPRSVRNGSDYVILDCQYALLPDDLKPDSGLVVKWFYNNSPSPVYQWIPGELFFKKFPL